MWTQLSSLWLPHFPASDAAAPAIQAGNPATPPDTLAELAAHESREVRLLVAANPAAPGDTLLALILSDDSSDMALAIAGNRATAPWLLTELAARSDQALTMCRPSRNGAVPRHQTRTARIAAPPARHAHARAAAVTPAPDRSGCPLAP